MHWNKRFKTLEKAVASGAPDALLVVAWFLKGTHDAVKGVGLLTDAVKRAMSTLDLQEVMPSIGGRQASAGGRYIRGRQGSRAAQGSSSAASSTRGPGGAAQGSRHRGAHRAQVTAAGRAQRHQAWQADDQRGEAADAGHTRDPPRRPSLADRGFLRLRRAPLQHQRATRS